MSNTFFCSDHHLGHANILVFKNSDGSNLRSFSNIDEMHETLIERHNSVVAASDRVYFLGDVCINKKYLHLLHRFNGRKVLVKGNHDIFKLDQYIEYFDDIRGSHQFKGLVMSHIPIHPESLSRWGFNVHGHLHNNVVTLNNQPDSRYFNVSVERLVNYTPYSLDEVMSNKP